MEEFTAEYLKELLLKNEYQCHLRMEKKDHYAITTTNESVKEPYTFIRGVIFINISQTTIDKIEEIINTFN